MEEIENLLKRIGDKTLFPFNIICNVGFIVEDSKEVKYAKNLS